MEGGTTTAPRPFLTGQTGFLRGGGRFFDKRGRGGGGRGGGSGAGSSVGGGDPKDQGDRLLDPGNPSFDGKRMRKAIHRKTVDYNPSMIHYLENRVFQRDHRDRRAIQPDATYAPQLMPPSALLDKPMNCVTTKFVRTSTNKFRCPIFCLAWTPEGRRLVTGASSGEFTLWNGLTFNFETILQAHDVSVRAMRWSHNDLWMVTADHGGYIKYWQSNMNNVKMYQGHKEPIRGVSFCPTDTKFATCSDDGTVRIWDFMRCFEEKILRGHGADVKCVDWHPQKSLVASGSKDNQQPVKLWDPRSGSSLATLHAHKHTVMDLKWNQNGHWLLTASRDHMLKVFDIRNMKTEMQTFKGHKKEATSLAWHPVHESLFTSGGSDGSLMFWIVGCDREVGSMEEAHEGMVWSLDWHPLGHILVSGSNDHTTKFWTRNRPGDEMQDRYNLNNLPAGVEQEILEYSNQDIQAVPNLPGMGLEHGLPEHLKPKEEECEELPNIPGLDWNQDSLFFKQIAADRLPVKKIPFARPIPRSFEKAWQGQELPQTSVEKAANKPGLLGLPPSMTPATLNLLMQGNPANIPPAVLVNIMAQMQKQPQLMALGQQMLLKHQQDLLKQQQQLQQQKSGNSGPGKTPQNNVPQQHPMQQQQNLLQNLLQQQQNLMQKPPNAMQQQQNPMQNQQQLGMPPQQRTALLQTPQPMGMRPMMPDGQNQFQPAGPAQPQFRPEGNGKSGAVAGQKQFGPGGPPAQFGQPPIRFPGPPQPAEQPSKGPSAMDQDHRRPFMNANPNIKAGPPTSQMQLPMDTDFRRSGPSTEQFPAEGDQDMRRGGGSGPPSMGRGLPHQGGQMEQQQEMFEDSDMRSQKFHSHGQESGNYDEDEFRDFDARGRPGSDVDERYPQHEMGRGNYSAHGFQDNRGGPGQSFEEDGQNRKRSWQDGPGRGGLMGRAPDTRRGGNFSGERNNQPGRIRGVYNGPVGPIEPKRGGMTGERGRGRGQRSRGRAGRGGW